MSPALLTFACVVALSPAELACPAADFRSLTRNSFDGAASSSSVPESTLTFSLISGIVSYT